MITFVELGLIVLVVSFGVTLANLVFNANKNQTTLSENAQLKALVTFLLNERRKGKTGPLPTVPPFLNFDVEGDVTIGGDVSGRDIIGP